MEWKYYKENICTGRPVASASLNGKRILYVYAERDSYYTQPYLTYLKSAYITFFDARKMNTHQEENMERASDVLLASLVHACQYFEEDFNNQKIKIMNEFGI